MPNCPVFGLRLRRLGPGQPELFQLSNYFLCLHSEPGTVLDNEIPKR